MSGTSVDRIVGTLISVVAHKGDASQGHFICYSKLDDSDVFYVNSDSRSNFLFCETSSTNRDLYKGT